MRHYGNISNFFRPLWKRIVAYFKSFNKEKRKRFFREQVLQTQDSNLKMVFAIGFGVFMGIVPVWGFQTIIALLLAAFFRLNKAIVLLATNISFPPIIPAILYFSFLTGGYLLNKPSTLSFNSQFDMVNIQNDLIQYYLGALVFAVFAAFFLGLISYFFLFFFRREIVAEKVTDNKE